jgi:hypothetical protein
MALTPTDMLKIQSAIDAYENKFPRRPSPTAVEALAWQASKRGRLWPSRKSNQKESDGVRPPAPQAALVAGQKVTPRGWIGRLFLVTR